MGGKKALDSVGSKLVCISFCFYGIRLACLEMGSSCMLMTHDAMIEKKEWEQERVTPTRSNGVETTAWFYLMYEKV